MPKDATSKDKHPLLTKGDVNAGMLFVQVLQEVIRPVQVYVKGRKGRAPIPKSKKVLLENRGFSLEVRAQIVAGELAVSEDAIRQLLFDFYAAFPKRVRDGAREYLMLKSIVDGNWDEFPELCPQKKARKRAKVMPQLHALFTTGDSKLGGWFVQTVSPYRVIRRQLLQQVTAAQLQAIETGKLPLPQEVFVDVMQRFEDHFATYPNDVKPRPYRKLRDLAVAHQLIKTERN